MEKIFSLLKTKKFWVLVSAIVAALSAFFLTGCTGYQLIHRNGVHVDTVKYEQFLKHKDFLSCRSFQKELSPLCYQPFYSSISCLTDQIFDQTDKVKNEVFSTASVFGLPFPQSYLIGSEICVPFSQPTMYPTLSFVSLTCSDRLLMKVDSSSKLPMMSYGLSYSMCALLPLSLLRTTKDNRRERRKSKPKKTKSVPLTGSHF